LLLLRGSIRVRKQYSSIHSLSIYHVPNTLWGMGRSLPSWSSYSSRDRDKPRKKNIWVLNFVFSLKSCSFFYLYYPYDINHTLFLLISVCLSTLLPYKFLMTIKYGLDLWIFYHIQHIVDSLTISVE